MSLTAAGESLEIAFFNLTLAHGLLLVVVPLLLVDDSVVVTPVLGRETKSPLEFSTSPLGALRFLGAVSGLKVMHDDDDDDGDGALAVVASLLESFILLEMVILFLPPVDTSLQLGGR
jgi:hypothetical protein